jgi:GDPmannose 4,6-dehydratase
MKRALILGSRGQDGELLTRHLTAREYHVVGVDRDSVDCSRGSSMPPVDVMDPASIHAFVRSFQPAEVYYLAAFHHSSQSTDLLAPAAMWSTSFDIHVHGLINTLEALRDAAPEARLFYAASSLVFGEPEQSPQTEAVPLNPQCVYGITKAAGSRVCDFYRQQYSIHAGVGFLYNHESHLRTEAFLSRKIVKTAVRIKHGEADELVLGNLSAQSDWGYAPDYVDAMHRIVNLPEPDDFVVATGRLHCVQDWVEAAFGALDLDWRRYCREDPSLITRRKRPLVGDSSKLRDRTGWRPATSFADMVSIMVEMEGAAHVKDACVHPNL